MSFVDRPGCFLFAVTAQVVLSLCLLLCGAASAEQNPLSYARFAFIAGDWAMSESDPPSFETFSASPILERGVMKIVLHASDPLGGEGFTELWLVGWDKGGEYLYMDVYTSGGWRVVMEGKMVVPSKVWVFETPLGYGHDYRERRTFTRISDDEIVIRYEMAEGVEWSEDSFERTYSRLGQSGETEPGESGTGLVEDLLTEIETAPEPGDEDGDADAGEGEGDEVGDAGEKEDGEEGAGDDGEESPPMEEGEG